MESGYKLFKGDHLVTVKYSYFENIIVKNVDQIIEEISWVALHKDHTMIIDEPCKDRFIIYAKDDCTALEVLLTYLEMQLLL